MSAIISEDKVKIIKYMSENGNTQKDIANEIGVSAATVRKYQKINGIKASGYHQQKIPETTEHFVIEKYKAGWKYKKIAEICGIGITTIRVILERNNVQKRSFRRCSRVCSEQNIVAAEELRVALECLNDVLPENLLKWNINAAITNAIRLLKEEPVE